MAWGQELEGPHLSSFSQVVNTSGAWLTSPWEWPPGALLAHLMKPVAQAFSHSTGPSRRPPLWLHKISWANKNFVGTRWKRTKHGFESPTVARLFCSLFLALSPTFWGMEGGTSLGSCICPGLVSKHQALTVGKQESCSVWGDPADAPLCPFPALSSQGACDHCSKDHIR